jgi:hypothetical protein
MMEKKNKRGVMGIIFFFLVLFTIMIIGFIAVMVVSVGTYANDVVEPVLTDLGVVGETNLTQAGEITFGTVNILVSALPWLLTFSYVAMLIFSVVFVVSWNYNPNPIFMGLYFLFAVLLIFGAIVISNMYQNIYTGTDVIAQGLQSQAAMSYLLLYSPWIFGSIALIVGIYVFAGKQTEFQGDFGI